MTIRYQDRITIEPGKRGGQPCIRGMRITVYDVLSYLAAGMTQEEVLADFPDLTLEDIRACLASLFSGRTWVVGAGNGYYVFTGGQRFFNPWP